MPRVIIAMPAWWLGYRDLATLEIDRLLLVA
jgi:hypothetical protein